MKQVYHRKFDAVSTEDKLREDLLDGVITALTYGSPMQNSDSI